MTTEMFVVTVFFLVAWLLISQSYKLGDSIIRLLLALEEYAIVRKDTPTPTIEEN